MVQSHTGRRVDDRRAVLVQRKSGSAISRFDTTHVLPKQMTALGFAQV
jgi:hypothetical protein